MSQFKKTEKGPGLLLVTLVKVELTPDVILL